MRFTNFASGCLGKVFSALLCVLLGVVLTVGGVALGGYVVLTREGMLGTLEKTAQDSGLPIDFDDDYESWTLLEWGTELFATVKDLNSVNIGTFEKVLGYAVLSTMIEEAMGVSKDIVKESTISALGETIADNLTLNLAQDKFGIEYPSLPIFSDSTFLSQPLATAFKSLDNYELRSLVSIDDNSSVLLKNIADIKIGELSDSDSGLDSRINGMKLGEVIEITEESSHGVLYKLKDVAIGQLGGAEGTDKINSLALQDVMDIESPENGGTKILYALRNASLVTRVARYGVGDPIIDANGNEVVDAESGKPLYYEAGSEVPDGNGGTYTAEVGDIVYDSTDNEVKILGVSDMIKTMPLKNLVNTGTSKVWGYLGEFTIDGLGVAVDNMCIGDAVEITASSHAVLRKMRTYNPEIDDAADEDKFGTENIKVSEIGTKLPEIIKTLTIGEIITIDESTSEPLLIAIKDTSVDGLNTKISTLTVAEVFRPSVYQTGALSLISPDTRLTSISSEITAKMTVARIAQLRKAGLIQGNMTGSAEILATVLNQTLKDMFEGYIDALNGTPSSAIPKRIYLDGAVTEITADDIAAITDFAEGATLVLGADVTISGSFNVMFNIMTNGFELTIAEGTTFAAAPDGENLPGGYMFISNSAHAADPIDGGAAVDAGGKVLVTYDDDGTLNEDAELAAADGETLLNGYFLPTDIAAPARLLIGFIS